MDLAGLGLDLKLLRRRRGWTQRRLSTESGVSVSAISLIECGRADRVTVATITRIAEGLGARLSVRLYWQGEALDRLRDRRHAAIVEWTIQRLATDGWTARAEVSFSQYGERGSIDILAFHTQRGAVLVIEVKSVVPDLQAMLANLDRKSRLAAGIARSLGWEAESVSRLLVLPNDRSAHRRVHEHEATFASALPLRTIAVKRWLRDPAGALAGILFVPNSIQDGRGR